MQNSSISSDEEKRSEFQKLKIAHPRIASVLAQLEQAILPDSGFDIVMVVGPTGVGKTSVLEALNKRINEQHHQEMLANPGFIPCIRFEIPEPGPKQFAWSTFYMEPLMQLNDPVIKRKVQTIVNDGITSIKPLTSHANVAALQTALKRGLKIRGTRAVIIDEAAHLLGHAHGLDLVNLTNAFKSMANGGATIVIAGSYDLLKLMDLNAQLSRRICVIHFDRYHHGPGFEEDEGAFRNSLTQMQNTMPTPEKPNFLQYSLPLQQRCIGCVGILKEVFQRALLNVLKAKGRDKGIWTLDHLNKALLSSGTVKVIENDTTKGETEICQYLNNDGLDVDQQSRDCNRAKGIPKKEMRNSQSTHVAEVFA